MLAKKTSIQDFLENINSKFNTIKVTMEEVSNQLPFIDHLAL